MDAPTIPSVVLWIALLLVFGGLGTLYWAWLARRSSGLPKGRIIYTDTSDWQRAARPLFSREYRLAGKPDYVVREGGAVIPVEVKSSRAPAAGPREGHILQLAAYCLLVEETEAVRPAYGIVRYADQTFRVEYTPALRKELLFALGVMRGDLARGDSRRNHADPARCRHCGYRDACDERLA